MKLGFIPLALGMLAVWPAYAAVDQATATSNPSPIVSTKAFEVTIQTSDFGSDVYCYTWAVLGAREKTVTDWAGALSPAFKMQGGGGTYTFKVADIKAFYKLSDSELEQLTRLGFIARTQSDRQTADCFVEVVQGRRNAYSGGEGTSENPFILKTADDINALAATPADWEADVWLRLDADINLQSSFSGIGAKNNPFKGHFDGNCHLVKGVSISNSAIGSATGFFNAIEGATISRLGLTEVNISGSTFTGALVGYAASGTISRCFSAGSVSSSSICVGGLAGENHASISDCYSIATVTTTDYVAGGLIGKNKGSVSKCYSSGAVSAYNYVGGLIGANYGTVAASTSFNPQVTGSVGNYAGKFGGNDNPRNSHENTLSWSAMPMAATATHGHHADAHSYRLVEKATYQDVLGWDFNSIWEWKKEGTHEYPVLAGLPGQVDPGHIAFYDINSGIVDILDSGADEISVFPNPVDATLHVSSAKRMDRASLYSLGGALAGDVRLQNAADAEIDCSSLSRGVYLLNVSFSDGSHTLKKIIKK